jgi:hypothetical protein
MSGEAERMACRTLSLPVTGRVSYTSVRLKLDTWIAEANPVTLSFTSCLNPRAMAMEIIITVNPMAMPAMAMVMAGLDTRFPSGDCALYMRRAMNNENDKGGNGFMICYL